MKARKNNTRKVTVALLSIILVLCCTIGGTLAWLSAQTDPVTNTFTVGDINITLTETTGTSYKIIPGGESAKNPTVTVKSGSEKCYVYVAVTNNVKLDDNTIVATPDIDADKWKVVGTSGDTTLYRYYQDVDASSADVTCQVFTKVTYSDTIEKGNIESLTGKTIVIDAYAHQYENTTQDAADTAAKAHFGFPTSTT